MYVRLLHLAKALLPIDVTLAGISQLSTAEQARKQEPGISVIEFESLIVVAAEQNINAAFPTVVTESGIMISLRDIHFENALSPIVVMPEG